MNRSTRLNKLMNYILSQAQLASVRGEDMIEIETHIDDDLKEDMIKNLSNRNLYAEPLTNLSGRLYGIYLEMDDYLSVEEELTKEEKDYLLTEEEDVDYSSTEEEDLSAEEDNCCCLTRDHVFCGVLLSFLSFGALGLYVMDECSYLKMIVYLLS